MLSYTSISGLANCEIIIYGAGSLGRNIYTLLTVKANILGIVAFCDTYKTGTDAITGLKIISPEDLDKYKNAVVIIGLSDYLKPETVQEIEHRLVNLGIPAEQIIRYSQVLTLFSEYSVEEFEWRSFAENVYDFDTNHYLIQCLSDCISEADKSVVDLGAGNMNLRKFLSPDTVYFPVDYERRCSETIVCDFNRYEFPDICADVYVLCAVLYYVENPAWLLEKCADFASKKIVIALHDQPLANKEIMHVGGLKNHMYFDEIKAILEKRGFFSANDVTIESVSRRYVVYKRT